MIESPSWWNGSGTLSRRRICNGCTHPPEGGDRVIWATSVLKSLVLTKLEPWPEGSANQTKSQTVASGAARLRVFAA